MTGATWPLLVGALPVDDWQFWVATLLALGAIALILRPLIPRKKSTKSACPGCPSGEAASKPPRPKHVDLTIGGKRVRNGR
jgi:hypothetical protein